MILKTIQDQSTGATTSIGLFGKSISDLKNSISFIMSNGILNTIFNTSTIDGDAVFKYNEEIEKAITSSATMAQKQQIMKSAMEGTNKATAQLIGTTKGAIVETDALIAAQEQSTLKARIQATALQGLAMAGNMIALAFITKGIEFVVKGIDNLAHSTEHCKKRVDDLMSSYQSALNNANSNAKTVESLASRYEKLSAGVNSLGENVSLSTDEYSEYNDIVNQIADMFPTLIQGYTSEGNAILSLKGNVEELRDTYKEAQQEAYNMLITSGKDSDGNDIINQWKNTHDTGFWADLFDFGADDVGGGISVSEALEQLKTVQNMSVERYREIRNIFSSGSKKDYDLLSDSEKKIGYSSYLYKALGLGGNMTDEAFAAAQRQAKALAQTYQAEINSALSDVRTLANAYLMTNEDYAKLDNQSQNAASIIVNSIDEGIADGFNDKTDVSKYVNEIVDIISKNPEIISDSNRNVK